MSSRGRAIRRVAELAARGLVPPERVPALERVAARYAVALTPEVAGLIDPGDAADPIARQFVPDARELAIASEEQADPIGDGRYSPLKGIVHRYPDRVLLKPHHTCAVYCRFCFRREQVGPGGKALSASELGAALDYISARPEIWEVIVTGGDPFLMSPRRLAALVRALDAIEHLGVIRFHTRVPMVDPARVNARFVRALRAEKAVYVALHVNHPREITPEMRAACARMSKAGIPLLSQTVLLRGVNDDAAILERLFRGLVAARIKPYYLHHPDLAPGTAQFRLGLEEGQGLVRRLRGRVSGLCQPTYVLDLPSGAGKVPVGPAYLSREDRSRSFTVEDYRGALHRYPPNHSKE